MDVKMPILEKVFALVSTQYISKYDKEKGKKIYKCGYNTYINKINKVSVLAVHHSEQVFVSWHSDFTSGVRCDNRVVVIIEEHLSST